MRCVTLAGLVAITLTATACSFHVGAGGGTNSGGGGSGYRAPPPPKRSSHGTQAPAPPPAPAPAPAPATPAPAQANAVAPAAAPAAINVAKVQEIRTRNPKGCGFVEVSPGNWVHVDCKKYIASRTSITHHSARKAKVFAAHKQLFKPIHHLRVKPLKPAGTGGGVVEPNGNGGGQQSEAFPSTVDHRAMSLEGPVKSQGGVGSCTAHSLSSALDNAAIRAGNLRFGDANLATSPLHVWSRYGLPDMGAAADGNIGAPVSYYQNWPQSDAEACKLMQNAGSYAEECGEAYHVTPGSWRSDPALKAKYDKAQADGHYKIASFERLQAEPANMEEFVSVLATGADLWIAVDVDTLAWSNPKMVNAVIQPYTHISGGHAVLVSGYRDTPSGRQFMIHNSWGIGWGDGGYAWMPEAMLNKYMYYAYRVKITNPVPKEQLTDDDCAPDELIDQTTGICAVMCGDNRPDNGCH